MSLPTPSSPPPSPPLKPKDHPLSSYISNIQINDGNKHERYSGQMKSAIKSYYNLLVPDDHTNATILEMKELEKRIFVLGINNLGNILTGKKGQNMRKTLETKGHAVIRNPLGPGMIPLYDEIVGCDLVSFSNQFQDINVTAKQVSYNQLFFLNNNEFGELEQSMVDGTLNPKEDLRIAVASEDGKTAHHLPLLSQFVKYVVTNGISHVAPSHNAIHGSILASSEGICEDSWVPPFTHSDFPVDKLLFKDGDAKSLTVYYHLGPEPIDLWMGSISQKCDNKNIGKTITLQPGDMSIWSWKQWHKTGNPAVFPTKSNYRFHLQVAANKDLLGSSNGSVDIHCSEDERYKAFLDPKPKKRKAQK